MQVNMKRTTQCIRNRAQKLNIKSNKNNYWTIEELQILVDNYYGMSWKEMENILPKHTATSIPQKWQSLPEKLKALVRKDCHWEEKIEKINGRLITIPVNYVRDYKIKINVKEYIGDNIGISKKKYCQKKYRCK